MDAAVVDSLKAKYPAADLILLTSQSAEVVAKIGKAEVDMFRELISTASTKARAMERFVRACIVHPSQDELLAILNKKPGLIEKWGEELLDEAGAAEEVERKKL